MSFSLEFKPWKRFQARKNEGEIHRWLRGVADASAETFRSSMKGYPPASSPGEYPAVRTGRLRASIGTEVTHDSATVGSNMFYSIFLRMGTSKMARRKMSDDALKEGMEKARLGRWVEWTRK
jgi:phage gpG-like protein